MAPQGPRPPRLRAVIAIPARDEAARLPDCLSALARQQDSGGLAVLVLANNCRDDTAAVARALAPGLPFRLEVREATLDSSLSHAGGARRAAMEAAADLLAAEADPRRAVLLSTDADGRAEPGWLDANLAALAAGADAVAGAIAADPAEAALLPPALRRQEAQEAHYAALLDEMAALVDPDPHDPWPRHAAHSGASIALTLAAYRRVGGPPAVPVGEDRALFEALIRADMRVRHCPAARVVVSCRLDGRAAGGMADTLRRRLAEAGAAPLDASLEPALNALLRLRCRRALRRLRAGQPRLGDPVRLALALGMAPSTLAEIVRLPRFWSAWEGLQARALPLRHRRPLRASAVGVEIDRATALLGGLRGARALVSPRRLPEGRAAGPAGSDRRATAA
ncbi:glycosyltransferase [Dankookia rubra]|uniref:glycosyltransferase n=1 Tax=Dankookia rubra TaxID=1442381 RepID=UPI0014083428|nr:glycosyltransferase [Dankookia rubra]